MPGASAQISSPVDKLLHPSSIALIGASQKEGKVGRIVYEMLLRSKIPLFPVNPFEPVVLGQKSYQHIEQISDPVDLAIIVLSAENAVGAAEQCAKKGVACIVVIAGGFGETGDLGRTLELKLLSLHKRHGCRILGPNTLGVFVPSTGLDTIFVDHADASLEDGGVAFVTQSGSIGVESLGLASNTGFGLRAFVGLGNKTDLNELDFLEYFEDDKNTRCIACYIEDFVDGRSFLQVAERIAAKKPVLVLKAGRTESGASAVSSHTGRMAGSDRVVSGAFRQFGIQRAIDDEELTDAAKTLSLLPSAQGNRVAVLTPAGGYGVMCTDYIESGSGRAALQMAQLSPATSNLIKSLSFDYASAKNPVDLTAGADNLMFINALHALLADRNVDIVICIAFFAPPMITDSLVDTIAEEFQNSHKPVLVFTQYGPWTEKYLKEFYRRGIVGFPSISRVVRAARFLVERGEIVRFLEAKK